MQKKSRSEEKVKFHLWIYNHSFTGVSDQIEFFVDFVRDNGIEVSIGNRPSETCTNILIENFQAVNVTPIYDYFSRTKKRVVVIMTEHIDFLDNVLYFHGAPIGSFSSEEDYMHTTIQVDRLKTLIRISPLISNFLTLGDLPLLNGLSEVFLGKPVVRIPFPTISDEVVSVGDITPKYDLAFSGAPTSYRLSILNELEKFGYSVNRNTSLKTRHRKNEFIQSAKVILNLPQHESWSWLSLMRIYTSLKQNRTTVSISTNDDSKISNSCTQLNIRSDGFNDILKGIIENWTKNAVESQKLYNDLAETYKKETVNSFRSFLKFNELYR